MKPSKKILSVFFSSLLLLIALPSGLAYATQEPTPQTPVLSAKPTPQQLQQLVAPIALYPDSLVAQILAASTYPDQVVEADRWVQANASVQGEQLAQAVDQQAWDPSVKALAEFPWVLANMDKNLSWTSSLGDAYINDQQDIMNAVQIMRQSAEKAGNLKSTPQLGVSQQGQTILIEPADPQIVYVPEYDPWIVYGDPILAWPGWYAYPGLYWNSPGIAFGAGFGIGFFGGYGWGWHHWAPDWNHRRIDFNHSTYVSRSRTIINRNYYANRTNTIHNGGGGFRGGNAFHGETHAAQVPQHGFAAPRTGDPIGVFAGKLASRASSEKVEFYQGYYYRILREEPAGIVLVAYPADYGLSGVMTFLVVGGGTVYENDLGPKTAMLAPQVQGKRSSDWNAVQ